ncbi:MAG: hypothetical protein ACYTEK_15890 [Planctomycetota bacterium]|jgi:hypothetical protein
MFGTEEERIRKILHNYKRGAGWVWNPKTKRIEPASHYDPDQMHLTAEDLGHAGERRICA